MKKFLLFTFCLVLSSHAFAFNIVASGEILQKYAEETAETIAANHNLNLYPRSVKVKQGPAVPNALTSVMDAKRYNITFVVQNLVGQSTVLTPISVRLWVEANPSEDRLRYLNSVLLYHTQVVKDPQTGDNFALGVSSYSILDKRESVFILKRNNYGTVVVVE